jgi:broad specificity phosphatase PhoE
MRFTSQLTTLKNRYFLLRHGETDANKQKVYMGRLNYGLNEKGREQAWQVTLPLMPDLIIVSPLKRTKETAAVISATLPAIPTHEDTRLIEKSGGDIEGKTYDEIAKKHPESWGIWNDQPIEYILKAKFPNGESDQEVISRVEEFIVKTELQHQHKTILLVTHSGVIQALRYLAGKSKEEIYLTPIPACHVEVLS